MSSLEQLVDSNARSIQALAQEWRTAVETTRIDVDTVNRRLEAVEANLAKVSALVAQTARLQAETQAQLNVLASDSLFGRDALTSLIRRVGSALDRFLPGR